MTPSAERGLRALFVTGSLAHGGAERHAIVLVNRLRAACHECHLAWVKDDAAQLDRLQFRERGSVRCLGAAAYLDTRALADLALMLDRVAPDVIVAQNPYALLYAAGARRLARHRPPLVVTFHSNRLLGVKEQLQMAVYRPLFWSAACTVFVCHAQRRRWQRRGVLSRRNEVIHNGVDTAFFRPPADAVKREAIRQGLGFSPDDYVVGITAGLRPEKNHAGLVTAIARLCALGLPARALLIGDGELRPAIEAQARQLGISGHVRITGFQDDVRPFIQACDTMAMCSFTEALPLAAIEAMAIGRPVVHSDVGGAAEIVEPGRNGYLYPVHDTDALVDHLARLADPELRARLGEAARRTAVERFSEDAMFARYEALLGEVSARGRRRTRVAVAAAPPARPVVLLLGPELQALSGVSSHLRSLLGSALGDAFSLVHFPVGSEGRDERLPARIARLAASPFALARAIRQSGAALVHVNTSLNAGAFWRDLAYMLVARACGAHVVCQVHGGALPQDFLALRPLDGLLRWALRRADAIVVLAQSELTAYRRFLRGWPIHVVPNAVACAPEPPGTRPPPGDGQAIRLVYVGRLAREKGLYDLVHAVAACEAGSARLTIAGGGPEESRLRRRVADLGLDGAVEFAGPVFGDRKARLLGESDVFVLPSYAEGLPYALLEGMAAGAPVIATPVGAIPDIVTDGVHGLFVPARDPGAIARAIRVLHGDRALLGRMARASRERVREVCSIEAFVGKFSSIYAGLDAPGGGRPRPAG